MSEDQIEPRDTREGEQDDASRELNVAGEHDAANEDSEKASSGGERNAGNEASEKTSFTALGLGAPLTAALAKGGILEPTSVQAGVIPELLAGRDGVLRSPTGSGKTLAYLLPLLQLVDPGKRETQAVVIAPTQELAMQIVRVSEQYGEPLGVKTVALIGGAALSRQLDRMKGKPAIVVGTPGRIREVASLRKLPLHAVRHVVVDETDRVFSLGGKQDVEFVLKGSAPNRQTVFVSATRSDTMRAAESKWLRDPWETTVRQEQEPGLPQTIEHLYLVSDPRDKIDLVRRLIRTMKPASTLLFVNDIERIGELLAKLRFEGFSVDALYGDTPGRERGEVLRRFREGKTKLLIASDVAARGLDVPELALVLQFEPALDADHYVHRAGRTGRMGRSGTSITIVTPKETFIMDKLGKQLRIAIREQRLAHGCLGGAKGEARREPADGSAKVQGGRSQPAAGQAGASRAAGPKRASGAHAAGAAGRPGASGRSEVAGRTTPAGSSHVSDRGPKRTLAGRAEGAAERKETAGREARAPGGRSPEARASAGAWPEASFAGGAGPKPKSGRGDAPLQPREGSAPLAGGKNAGGKSVHNGGKSGHAGGKSVPAVRKGSPSVPAAKPGKPKEDRERDRKNKGAPRWLKEKRANNEPQA